MEAVCETAGSRQFSSLCELLRRRAEDGDACGYTFLREDGGAVHLGWRELDERARRVAAALERRLGPGERVLLVHRAGFDFLAALFGCLYARLLAAPLPLAATRAGFEKFLPVMEDSGARLALTDASHLAAARTAIPGLAWEATEDLVAQGETGWEGPMPEADELAYLQYTSGSTRSPRGVMLTHGNVLHNLANIDAGFRHGPDSVVVSWLPHFHDMGLIYGLLAPLYGGFPCYWMAPATFVGRPRAWLEAISTYRATHSGGPNFAYELCVRRIGPEDREGLDLGCWEVAFNGAEPVQAETLERFSRAFAGCGFRASAFYPAYGLAEATLKVSGGERGGGWVSFKADAAWLQRNRVREAAGGPVRRLVGCGRPALETRVVIVDPETGRRCAPDEVGEIWVAGPGVAQGYWGRPEETRATFGAFLSDTGEGPFLRTGDLGFLRDGELYIAGRLKDLIIIRGLNHHPNDIEATARRAHPEVASSVAAAFAIEAEGEEKLALAIEAAGKGPEDAGAIAVAVRQAIAAEHEVQLHAFALVAKGAIPRTSSGKVQRGLCRSRYLSGELPLLYHEVFKEGAEAGSGPKLCREDLDGLPRDELEARLGAWLRQAAARKLRMNREALDPERPLLAYGLDSLAALEIGYELERELGVAVPLEAVLEGAGVARLAAILAERLICGRAGEGKIASRGAEKAPLSLEQERLWLLEQLAPGSAARHIPVAVRIRGRLDTGLIERGARELLKRHPSLRTSARSEEGRPFAVCETLAEPPLVLEDAAGFEDAWARARQEARRPFDLTRAPLWRLNLWRVGPEDHLCLAVMHHLIGDLWSVRILFEELFELYRAGGEGRAPELAPLEISYGDFAAWQRERLTAERSEQLQQWWRQHLAGAPRLELAPGRPRPNRPVFQAGVERFEVGGELARRLRETARERGMTLFTLLAGAMAALLARWTGQTDVVLGITAARRPRRELEGLIGYFAAPAVLRIDLRGDPDQAEIAERTRREIAAVYAHEELPFAQVAQAAGRGSPPLVAAMFSLVKGPIPGTAPAGLEFEAVGIDTGETDFELFITLVEEADRMRGEALFALDLLEPARVRAAVESYLRLLERWSDGERRRLSELEVAESLRGDERDVAVVALAATFTAEPVGEVLEFWFRELGLDYRVRFAPFNQVFQQLLDPGSLVCTNRGGANVLLVRLADWLAGGAELAERIAAEFVSALRTAAGQAMAPFLVVLCPSDSGDERLGHAEAVIAASFASSSTVQVVRWEQIAALYPATSVFDPHADQLGRLPYTPEFFAAVGTFLARRIHALAGSRYKVIVLDADQTLWRGVCAEDGPEGVEITAAHRRLQQFMRARRQAGMLLALVSKNNEADVEAVFAAHPEMPLSREDFVAWKVNWRPKSENLRALACELDLGLDSFLFVDDNPAECAEVEANCPEVLTLALPQAEEEIPDFLEHVWAFDRWAVTEEDRRRAEMYGERLRRIRLAHQVATLREFLDALQLDVRIERAQAAELARVAQLTQRTNQMNVAPRRRTETEVAAMLTGGAECLAVHVRDRFGSYGLVGVVIYQTTAEALEVDTFLLSCRALGRGVEHRMLARLGEIALGCGLSRVMIPYVKTARNEPAYGFLRETGAEWEQPAEGGAIFAYPAERAAQVTYDPDARVPVAAAREVPSAAAAPSVDYARIARELRDPATILEQVRGQRRPPAPASAYVPPATPLEEELATLWSQMLGVERVGLHENFFDLGGHSLLAVQMLGRVRERYQVELPLDVIFTGNFSVAELARAIELERIERDSPDEYAALLKELEGMSEEEIRALLEEEQGEGAT